MYMAVATSGRCALVNAPFCFSLCGKRDLAHTQPMRRFEFRHGLPALFIAAAAIFAVAASQAKAGEPQEWVAGVYSFSDELGGFTITGISGTGSKDDPIVITEQLNSSSPVTLVIRATTVMHPFTLGGDAQTGFTHLRFVTLNNSGLAWVEFEFELQEIKDVPSTFGDGLSFDQRRSESEDIGSDRFAEFSRDFEPYDRLRFREGKVDPLETSTFSFFVTDFTPRSQFYIVQDPRIPSS
jgi:hypothetical protein